MWLGKEVVKKVTVTTWLDEAKKKNLVTTKVRRGNEKCFSDQVAGKEVTKKSGD
jgi:hypothetical protein